MKLSELFINLDPKLIVSGKDNDPEIVDVCYDTRKIKPGVVFVCIKGAKADSHDLAAEAVKAGAVALVVEHSVEANTVPVYQVEDTRIALAYMAAEYFGRPAEKLKKVGITGTKGKTTTTFMLKAILEASGHKTGLMGSIEAMAGDKILHAPHNTTPESYEIQRLMAEMVTEGCEYLVMEMSSQGLKLNRAAGVEFEVGIFLDISRDHISPWEHATLEEYLYCKSLLFRQCKLGILNQDDAKLEEILKGHTCEVETYGFDPAADTHIEKVDTIQKPGYMGVHYTTTGKHPIDVTVGNPGNFTVYDSLAAFCAADHFGMDRSTYAKALEQVKILGRVETIDIPADYSVIIDFAHDGIGVTNLVNGLKNYKPNHIIAVFGSDGNRTTIRRADIGEILGNSVDYTIITSNSPRFEPLEKINAEIEVGVKRTKGEYTIIEDRRTAIKEAMKRAVKGDMILLIGKGHWTTEEINGVEYPFDERQVVKELYEEICKGI